jgi:hypothetical protein
LWCVKCATPGFLGKPNTDQTGVGEKPYEKIREFMPQVKGATVTAPLKQDILGRLRLVMEKHELTTPRDNSRLVVQITSKQCEHTISGILKFNHPHRPVRNRF